MGTRRHRHLAHTAASVLAATLVAVLAAGPVASASPGAPTHPRPVGAGERVLVSDFPVDIHSARPTTSAQGAHPRWPGRTIRFFSDMDETFDWSIVAAVGAWNRSGVDISFKRVDSMRRAQLLIRPTGGLGIFGEATVGYNPYGGLRNNWIKLSMNALKDRGSSANLSPWQRRVVTANILAHELGHTLGVDHQPQDRKACGLMMATLKVSTCDVTGAELGYYRCGMTDDWVLSRTVRMYGGRRTPGVTSCPILPIPAAPADLRISGGIEDDRPVQVDWTPPSSIAPGTMMHIRMSSGFWCPARVGRDQNMWPVWADDTFEEYFVDPRVGTWHAAADEWDDSHETRCFTARLVNAAGGSATPVSSIRTPWYPQPTAPMVLGVEQVYGDEYRVSLAEADMDDDSLEHFVFVYPAGQCGTEPITLAALRSGAGTLTFRTALVSPCIRVVALRGQRVSQPTSWQVT